MIPEQTLYDFLEGKVDDDTRRRIQAQMKIEGSPVQRWFAELQQWARNAYDVDWLELLSDNGAAIDVPTDTNASAAQQSSFECETDNAHPSPDDARPKQYPVSPNDGKTSRYSSRRRSLLVIAASIVAIATLAYPWLLARDPLASLRDVPGRWRPAVAQMAASKTVRVSERVVKRFHTDRGSPGLGSYIRPVRTLVREEHPLFQWTRQGDGVSYKVLIYRTDRTDPIAISPELRDVVWRPDESLPRGIDLKWEVQKGLTGLPLAQLMPRFGILSEADEAELAADLGEASGSPLARVSILLEAGLLDDAEHELNDLVQQYPRSTIASLLQKSLRDLR